MLLARLPHPLPAGGARNDGLAVLPFRPANEEKVRQGAPLPPTIRQRRETSRFRGAAMSLRNDQP